MCSRSTTTRAWQRTCPPTSATRSSSTASCTSIPGRDRAFTARTPPRRADALTLAGSSSRETTTNEQAPAPAVRRRFREEPDRRRPQPGRASGTCGGQPPAPNVDRHRQGSSVLRPLRRSRLLNDARRGPCGRTDQVGGREQAAEKVIVGSATPIFIGLLGLPAHLERGRLRERPHDYLVDVNVRRPRDREHDAFGHVLRRQRLEAVVDGLRRVAVALEADEAELSFDE